MVKIWIQTKLQLVLRRQFSYCYFVKECTGTLQIRSLGNKIPVNKGSKKEKRQEQTDKLY